MASIRFFLIIITGYCLLSPVIVVSQNHTGDSNKNNRICYTYYMTKLNERNFSGNKIKEKVSNNTDTANKYLVIPVVFHVIYNGVNKNISDEILKSQITVFNEDFGDYGPIDNDSRAVDTKIRFCLAKKDPSGNPTSGIDSIKSTYTDLISSEEMSTKNLSRWDQNRYFNIWVVNSIDSSGDIQGYSYLPSESGGPSFDGDGLVLVYKYVGRNNPSSPSVYDLGRTGVHETGHYLDLLHPWGSDNPGQCDCDPVNDGIQDTPPCSCEYFSAPPQCYAPMQCGYQRLIQDYMDYSLDACMKVFTNGQKNKMRNALSNYRGVLVSYNNLKSCGCDNISDSLNSSARIDFSPNPVLDTLTLSTFNKIPAELTFTIYDLYGRIIKIFDFPGVQENNKVLLTDKELDGLSPGLYIIKGQFLSQKFTQKIIIQNRH